MANNEGISVNTVRKYLTSHKIEWDHSHVNLRGRNSATRYDALKRIVEASAPKCRDPIRLHGNAIVTACWHSGALAIDPYWRVIKETAAALGIHRLIGLGDLISSDYYRRRAQEEIGEAAKPEQEYSAMDALLDYLKPDIKELVWVPGNHEALLLRILKMGIEPARLRGLLKVTGMRVTMAWQSYMFLDDWRLTHCRNYSVNRFAVERKLQAKFPGQKIGHAHAHRLSVGYSDAGVPMIEIPAMADPERMGYIMRDDTTHPQHTPGFFVHWQGNMVPYAQGFTDKLWPVWLEAVRQQRIKEGRR